MAQQAHIELHEILADIPVFEGLAVDQLDEIAQSCHVRRLSRGERIFCEGDRPRAFYLLVEGQVKRAVSSPEGDEKVLEIVGPGQSFGESELFGTRPYASFAEAVRASVVVHVARDAIHRIIERDPRAALALLNALAERQSDLERDAARRLKNGGTRVMEYLLDLAGSRLSTVGDTTFELGTSKQLIAARLGLTPETLSRAFRSLSDARLISIAGRRVTVHRPAGLNRAGLGGRFSPAAMGACAN